MNIQTFAAGAALTIAVILGLALALYLWGRRDRLGQVAAFVTALSVIYGAVLVVIRFVAPVSMTYH